MVAETEHELASQRKCPDGGKCTHSCGEAGCWRVAFCAPLSSYEHDDWTDGDRAANANPPTTIESLIVLGVDDQDAEES